MPRESEAAASLAGRVTALLCIGVALNLVSIAAPGYYKWDEFFHHFTYVADRNFVEALSGVRWLDFSAVHYRPLTFSIWSALSFFLYEKPLLLILSSVFLSVLNGVLIYYFVLRASGQSRAALWSFLAFNVFPSSAFVAGWFATIGDKLYLAFALCALHILLSD